MVEGAKSWPCIPSGGKTQERINGNALLRWMGKVAKEWLKK